MTTEELSFHYPRVFHMAESGTWESIRKNGLLSTLALLDLFGVAGKERERINSERRPESVTITHASLGKAVIRDQKPMSDGALAKCLQGSITPSDWYKLLNRRVFFWVNEKRLHRLLAARAYRGKRHCVLTLDTASLLSRHAGRVTLCHINSGSTIFKPQPRGPDSFKTINDYPFGEWRIKRSISAAVVELVVDYHVPDIADFVLRVEERRGVVTEEIVYTRG